MAWELFVRPRLPLYMPSHQGEPPKSWVPVRAACTLTGSLLQASPSTGAAEAAWLHGA